MVRTVRRTVLHRLHVPGTGCALQPLANVCVFLIMRFRPTALSFATMRQLAPPMAPVQIADRACVLQTIIPLLATSSATIRTPVLVTECARRLVTAPVI